MTFINEKHYREVSLKKYQILDRAKTEALTMKQSRVLGSKVETEARSR